MTRIISGSWKYMYATPTPVTVKRLKPCAVMS